MTTLDHALALVQQGYSIIPVRPNKRPYFPWEYYQRAKADESTVRAWWSEHPDALPAIVCGSISGVICLDLDKKNGKDGAKALRAMGVPLPQTHSYKTPSGGTHGWYTIEAGKIIKSKSGDGFDLQSDGRYAVYWPAYGCEMLYDGPPTPSPEWTYAMQPVLGVEIPTIGIIPPAEVAEIRRALSFIPADDRDVWLKIGQSIHQRGAGEQGYLLWEEWSRQSAKFDEMDQRRVWRSMKPHGGITIATLYHVAGQFQSGAQPAPPPPQAPQEARRLSTLEERLQSIADAGPAIPTGFKELDDNLRGGLRLGRTTVVGGQPGCGKTSFVCQIARNIAAIEIPIGWLAVDEAAAGIDSRNLQACGIPRTQAEKPDESIIRKACIAFGKAPFHPIENATVEDAFTLMAEQYPDQPRVIVIDSLQTASTYTSTGQPSIRERINDVLGKAKSLATQTKSAVIFISEQSRAAYRSKRDGIEDLATFKESGGIEYGADTLMVLKPAGETIEVSLPKNRLGEKKPFHVRQTGAIVEPVEHSSTMIPDVAEDIAKMNKLFQDVLEAVKNNPGASTRFIWKAVVGRNSDISIALEILARDKKIEDVGGGKGSKWVCI